MQNLQRSFFSLWVSLRWLVRLDLQVNFFPHRSQMYFLCLSPCTTSIWFCRAFSLWMAVPQIGHKLADLKCRCFMWIKSLFLNTIPKNCNYIYLLYTFIITYLIYIFFNNNTNTWIMNLPSQWRQQADLSSGWSSR